MAVNGSDALSQIIEAAVESAIKRAMAPASGRRLMKAAEAAKYLGLSRRQIYNMIANKELKAIRHGRSLMVLEIDQWIDHKSAEQNSAV